MLLLLLPNSGHLTAKLSSSFCYYHLNSLVQETRFNDVQIFNDLVYLKLCKVQIEESVKPIR